MNNKQNYRVCVGGIILLALTALGMLSSLGTNISNMIQQIQNFGGTAVASGLPSILGTLISSVPMLVFAVMLVMKMHGKGLAILSLVHAVLYFLFNIILGIASIISYVQVQAAFVIIPVMQLVRNLAYTLFLLTLAFLCFKATGKEPASARKLSKLPALLYIVYGVISVISTVVQFLVFTKGAPVSAVLPTILGSAIGVVISTVINAVCWFMIGSWIANPMQKDFLPQQAAPVAAPQPTYQPPVYSQPTYQAPQYQVPQQPNPAAAQELERYEQMLQAGVITQEEYNAARARLLGL